MIEINKYRGNLWDKETLTIKFDTLTELREIKKEYPSVTIYKFNDGCLSFKTLEYIKKELKNKTVKLQNGETKTLFDYYMDKGNIEKLENDYLFKCGCLRGYPNTYKIEWQTKDKIITCETKTNLWQKVTNTIETDKDRYAENTVRRVKLIPLYSQILTKEINFDVIRWYGGDTTTLNIYNDDDYKRTFNYNLFFGKYRRKKD